MNLTCSKCGDIQEIPDELIGDHTEEDITGYLCEACDPDYQLFDDIPFYEHPAFLDDDLENEDDCEDDPRRNGAITPDEIEMAIRALHNIKFTEDK